MGLGINDGHARDISQSKNILVILLSSIICHYVASMTKLFSTTIPDIEIHMANEPVALFISATGSIKPFKIKTKGRYFTVNKKDLRGIYTINNKYAYRWGKTPIYFYAVQETNTIDPLLIHELNEFKKKNKLTEIKRKDVKHASRFRTLMQQMRYNDAMTELKKKSQLSDEKLQAGVETVQKQIEKRIEDLKVKHNKAVTITDAQKTYVLLEHLRETQQIDEQQYAELMNKATGNILTFDNLILELRELNIVTISEPLDENVEDFIQDLGSCNAPDLAGHIQDLRNNKKGLKDMTASPVKSFIPASVLFVIILGVLIGIPIIVSQLPLIDSYLKHSASTGGGGAPFPMPWDLFKGGGFVFNLVNYLPNFILGLLA